MAKSKPMTPKAASRIQSSTTKKTTVKFKKVLLLQGLNELLQKISNTLKKVPLF